ncbi:FtsJ-like methyltransferase family protein [Colletotrichum camelliae]|nr:FtsJ-like methyltransferase family protein [Colletotrichum camelliae]
MQSDLTQTSSSPRGMPGNDVPVAQLRENVNTLSLNSDAQNADTETFERSGDIIIEFLRTNVPEFARLSAVRKKGWENPAGDAYFRKQREAADNADEKLSAVFYDMMKGIGIELHRKLHAFSIKGPALGPKRILDMCMAPGGFLAIALQKNPDAHALGFSLPVSQGGYERLIPPRRSLEVRFMDITMLAQDMGVTDIPPDHPDSDNFIPQQLGPQDKFHLVLCDGQVLRQHEGFRAQYRARCEARRLTVTQLALGLEHLEPGGTMVVLLHKVEAWDTVLLLREFSKFSTVRLFKPLKSHAKRSSFYMIASKVQSLSAAAAAAIKVWKEVWSVATFDLNGEMKHNWREEEPSAKEVIDEFGDHLIRLGKNVWKIQAEALERATFVKG